MATITTIASSDTLSASRTTINDNFSALRNVFASAVAPTTPADYQLWWDTTTPASPILKRYNSGGAAWIVIIPNGGLANGGLLSLSGGTMLGVLDMGGLTMTNLANATTSGGALNKGQADAAVHISASDLGTKSATTTHFLSCGGPAMTIVDVALVVSVGVTADAGNRWEFQVRNVTAGVDLRTSVLSTAASAITADANYPLTLDQNLTPAANAVLRLTATKFGTPADLTLCLVILKYKLNF